MKNVILILLLSSFSGLANAVNWANFPCDIKLDQGHNFCDPKYATKVDTKDDIDNFSVEKEFRSLGPSSYFCKRCTTARLSSYMVDHKALERVKDIVRKKGNKIGNQAKNLEQDYALYLLDKNNQYREKKVSAIGKLLNNDRLKVEQILRQLSASSNGQENYKNYTKALGDMTCLKLNSSGRFEFSLDKVITGLSMRATNKSFREKCKGLENFIGDDKKLKDMSALEVAVELRRQLSSINNEIQDRKADNSARICLDVTQNDLEDVFTQVSIPKIWHLFLKSEQVSEQDFHALFMRDSRYRDFFIDDKKDARKLAFLGKLSDLKSKLSRHMQNADFRKALIELGYDKGLGGLDNKSRRKLDSFSPEMAGMFNDFLQFNRDLTSLSDPKKDLQLAGIKSVCDEITGNTGSALEDIICDEKKVEDHPDLLAILDKDSFKSCHDPKIYQEMIRHKDPEVRDRFMTNCANFQIALCKENDKGIKAQEFVRTEKSVALVLQKAEKLDQLKALKQEELEAKTKGMQLLRDKEAYKCFNKLGNTLNMANLHSKYNTAYEDCCTDARKKAIADLIASSDDDYIKKYREHNLSMQMEAAFELNPKTTILAQTEFIPVSSNQSFNSARAKAKGGAFNPFAPSIVNARSNASVGNLAVDPKQTQNTQSEQIINNKEQQSQSETNFNVSNVARSLIDNNQKISELDKKIERQSQKVEAAKSSGASAEVINSEAEAYKKLLAERNRLEAENKKLLSQGNYDDLRRELETLKKSKNIDADMIAKIRRDVEAELASKKAKEEAISSEEKEDDDSIEQSGSSASGAKFAQENKSENSGSQVKSFASGTSTFGGNTARINPEVEGENGITGVGTTSAGVIVSSSKEVFKRLDASEEKQLTSLGLPAVFISDTRDFQELVLTSDPELRLERYKAIQEKYKLPLEGMVVIKGKFSDGKEMSFSFPVSKVSESTFKGRLKASVPEKKEEKKKRSQEYKVQDLNKNI